MKQLRLVELRKNLGLTQKEVANEVDISRPFYTQIEKGSRKPSFDVAIKIANFFGESVEKIFLPVNVTSCNKEETVSG